MMPLQRMAEIIVERMCVVIMNSKPDSAKPTSQPAAAPKRLLSIDAYRGLVMFLMLAETLRLARLGDQFPDSPWLKWISFHTSHVEWTGCSLHDLIQPGFSFLVGVSLPFSLAARTARGGSLGRLLGHALWRSLILVGLGIFLRSLSKPQTYFTFEDTLSQIGLGYFFLVLIGLLPRVWHYAAIGLLLLVTWTAFVAYPAPSPDFDYPSVGVPEDWSHHQDGLAAHWNKNSNLTWAFDRWWLNLFPREQTFTHHPGGYGTLSWIPTLATMLMGLLAGGWLREETGTSRVLIKFGAATLIGIGCGWGLGELGWCPVVKRIWSPSFALFSGGWCFLQMGLFHAICDLAGWKRWAYPLVVIGANSITAYVISWTMKGFILENLQRHLGSTVFERFGESLAPALQGAAILLCMWLILWWMYRQRIFVKI